MASYISSPTSPSFSLIATNFQCQDYQEAEYEQLIESELRDRRSASDHHSASGRTIPTSGSSVLSQLYTEGRFLYDSGCLGALPGAEGTTTLVSNTGVQP